MFVLVLLTLVNSSKVKRLLSTKWWYKGGVQA